MTQIAKISNASGGGQISYLYYLTNPATGANNVVISKTNSAAIRSASASYTGANGSAQPDASGTTSANAIISVTLAVTTVVDNCWMVSFAFNDAATTNADTGTTKRDTAASFQAIGDSNAVISPAGSYSMKWSITAGTGNWTMVNASIKPVQPAAGGTAKLLTGVGF